MNREIAIREALRYLENRVPKLSEAIPGCPLCRGSKVCKFWYECIRPHEYPYCIQYFERKSEEEGKPYWQCVIEHLRRELELELRRRSK